MVDILFIYAKLHPDIAYRQVWRANVLPTKTAWFLAFWFPTDIFFPSPDRLIDVVWWRCVNYV